MEEVSRKSGFELFNESVYTLEQLQKFLAASCLSEKFSAIFATSPNNNTICRVILTMLSNEELNLDEITTVFVAASMLYFINADVENRELRLYTLEKAFRYADTLNPVHIHIAAKRIWTNLKKDSNSTFNILSICHKIAVASETGAAIAICLAWAILRQPQENEGQMYCFHEFRDLLKLLNKNLTKQQSAGELYAFVQTLGFLINIIVFGDNEDFKKAGYRHYFNYTLKDLRNLKLRTTQLSDHLKVSPKAKDYWDLYMVITEYVNTNVGAVLQDKITDMSN